MRILLVLLLLFPLSAQALEGQHALALYGEPLYPAGFAHFNYVNPDAPKGGAIKVGAMGSFDTFTPYTLKGESAAGVEGFVYETLMIPGADEAFTGYGLLAESAALAPDRSSITFTLNPAAKFSDGVKVKASDVAWTFTTLMSKGSPQYRTYYEDVAGVTAVDKAHVTFTFKNTTNRELPLIVGQLPVLPEHAFKDRDFSDTTLVPPVGSGPYAIKSFQAGRTISYQRRADYWGRDLPVNRGRFNFGTIRYDYYRDLSVMFEAFKTGDLDFWQESIARNWATGYDIPAVKDGRIIKEAIKNEEPQGMQGFMMNTRRPIFADVKVRQALAYGLDFAWSNINLFYGQYTRSNSYFSNSELASSGIPEGDELAALAPFREQLPPELFTTPFALPETSGTGDVRENLKAAQRLLKDAGWELRNGVMTNLKTNQPLTFEIIIAQDAFERVVQPYAKNLARLGITATLRRIDSAQYINRMNEFDFDMTVMTVRQSLSPGNEQLGYWSSAAADVPGSPNYAGVKSPAVDALLEGIISAGTREEVLARVHALDRVLLWGWYVVPNWHISSYRVAYWNRFARARIAQKHGLGFLDTWWIDPAKNQALTAPAPKN